MVEVILSWSSEKLSPAAAKIRMDIVCKAKRLNKHFTPIQKSI